MDGVEISDDRLVKVYLKIREQRAANNKAAKDADDELKKQLATVNAELLSRMHKRGNEGFKTPHGAVYKAIVVQVTIADDSVFFPWVKEHDALDFLERRVKSTEVQKYMKEHGAAPPGLTIFKEEEARVRKDNSDKTEGEKV
jgi:hypothetical protein